MLLPALLTASPLAQLSASADDGAPLQRAYFSAGDPRFLQPAFEEIKYLGVKNVEVGSLATVPAVQVTYDARKLRYQRLLGAFWRGCDPTNGETQFGQPGPPIVWVASDGERAIAQKSRDLLNAATRYTSPTFGPMFKGRPIQAEIRDVPDLTVDGWIAAPEADQGWYLKEAPAFEKAKKKSGRAAWFEERPAAHLCSSESEPSSLPLMLILRSP